MTGRPDPRGSERRCDHFRGPRPCAKVVVERLEHFNTLTAGSGHTDVCAVHLAEFIREHCL